LEFVVGLGGPIAPAIGGSIASLNNNASIREEPLLGNRVRIGFPPGRLGFGVISARQVSASVGMRHGRKRSAAVYRDQVTNEPQGGFYNELNTARIV